MYNLPKDKLQITPVTEGEEGSFNYTFLPVNYMRGN
jgi:hypothetical protein